MPLSRRSFLASSLATSLAPAASAPIRLGGPIFLTSNDPAELAREHRRLGYSAAYCPKADPKDTAAAKAIEAAFARENVVIAEVGAWVNMLDANPAKRKANLDYVTERLQLAELVGARNCVDIAGSYNPTRWDGPDPRNLSKEFLDATVENCRKVIDAAKPKRTKFTIEMMGWSLPDGPDTYLQLIKAIDRKEFAVHVDICNILNSTQRYYQNAALIHECFTKLGRWIMSCHAKDVAPNKTHFEEAIPGRGGMDWVAYLNAIATYAPNAPLMLEHLKNAEEYDEARNFLLKTGRQNNFTFA